MYFISTIFDLQKLSCNNMPGICDGCKKVFPELPHWTALDELPKRSRRPCHCFCLFVLHKAGAPRLWWTCLRMAAHLNHVECMKALLEAGADAIYSNASLSTAVQEAAARGHGGCTRLLVDIAEADVINLVLSDAVWNNHKTVVEVLVNSGANVNTPDPYDNTYLIAAALQGFDEIIDILIRAGANVNAINGGMTPLIAAVATEQKKCIQQLLEVGADVNITVWHVDSALGQASAQSAELVKLLLEAGADVNIPSFSGGIIAFHSQCLIESARVLFKAGAKINVFNDDNTNTLKQITAKSHPSVNQNISLLLFAAGETIDGNTIHVPDVLLFEDQKLCLMHLCRETIRKHLLHLDPHQHLFVRVPKLGLPKSLQDYVLYNQTLGV